MKADSSDLSRPSFLRHACVCVCAYVYVCMHVFIYVCVCMHVRVYVCVCVSVSMGCVCNDVRRYPSMHVCMYVCMYVCEHACWYVGR